MVKVCFRRLTQLAGVVTTLLIFSQGSLTAATQNYEGLRIATIGFNPPQQPLLPKELAGKMASLRPGQPLRMADVRKAIQELYATGRYADVAVDAQPSVDGAEVTLQFITRNTEFVRNVVVSGVPEPPNEGQLVTATKLQLGFPYTNPQLKQAEEGVADALRSDGFYLASLNSQADHVPEAQQVDVTMVADPGKRAKFDTPIIKGNSERDTAAIIRATRWRQIFGIGGWRQVTQRRVLRGLDNIRSSYQKKDYLRAKVTLDQMEYHESTNTVTPVVDIEAGPKVVVTTHGAKIRKGKLKQLVPVYEEGAVDKDLLVEGQRNLAEYFQSKGYFETEVDFDLDSEATKEQVIDYSIAPGERHKFVDLQITGNKYFDESTLRERMYLAPSSLLRFHNGRYSQAYLRRDIESIKNLYQANGFRDVEVTSQVVDDYRGVTDHIAVFLAINEGAQWLVNSLEVTGVDQAVRDQLVGLIRSNVGQPYSDYNVAGDQDAVLNYFFNNGYPDATFEAAVKPSANPQRMDLQYSVTPGDRQYVRQVLYSGLKTTDPHLVEDRIRNLEEGSPLSQQAMNESQRKLYDLGVFARVDAAVQNPDGDEQNKYVLYRLEEARKYSLNVGFGAQIARIGRGDPNSLESAGGAAGFSPRVSFGINRVNLWGIGHTVGLQTRYSSVQKRAVVNYLAPRFKGNEDLNLTFTGIYDESFDINTFNARRLEISAQLSERLTKANTIQYRIAYRRVNLSQITITPALIPLYSQPVQLGIASITFIEDRRDDPADAHRGIYNTIDLGYSISPFGTKGSFGRALGRNATYHPIGRNLVFARSTSFGVISKFRGPDIPISERFFAGGASSHRGFAENQAGPRDAATGVVINGEEFKGTGFPLGGNALLLNTFEMRFPLIGDNVGGVLFHDAGNVYSTLGHMSFRWNQRDLTDFDYMVHAVGFGVRYRTPIGPIRVDLGLALNPPRFNGLRGTYSDLLNPSLPNVQFITQQLSHFQFHFSLGQAF